MQRYCEICGHELNKYARADKTTCGATCRKRKSRGQDGGCPKRDMRNQVPHADVDQVISVTLHPGLNQHDRRLASVTLVAATQITLAQLKRDMSSGLKPRLLDLFSGCGGCSVGYALAGFHVTGVDVNPQPYYPFDFIQADVFKLDYEFLMSFDVIHASPPCQAYSRAAATVRKQGKVYPDLYLPTKRLLQAVGKPWIIENVVGSPAKGIRLTGDMFGLGVLRERIFESSMPLVCDLPRQKVGSVKTGEYVTVAGSHGRRRWADAMGIQWADNKGIRQAIPPAFTEYLGKQIYDKLALNVTSEQLVINVTLGAAT